MPQSLLAGYKEFLKNGILMEMGRNSPEQRDSASCRSVNANANPREQATYASEYTLTITPADDFSFSRLGPALAAAHNPCQEVVDNSGGSDPHGLSIHAKIPLAFLLF